MMKTVFLIRYGEIGLKGKNRGDFEKALLDNILEATGTNSDNTRRHHGRIYMLIADEAVHFDRPEIVAKQQALSRTFGIVAHACAYRLPASADVETIQQGVDQLLAATQSLSDRTFRIKAKRTNNRFPLSASQINQQMGEYVLTNHRNWQVNLDNPDLSIYIEARAEGIFLYSNRYNEKGPGGLPTGVSGKGLLLLSGGIDSPAAGWLMLKRGMEIDPVYFHSYPYTSNKAKEKVIDLAKVLVEWKARPMTLYIPHFTQLQVAINKKCPQSTWTILHRRFMMRISERIAHQKADQSATRYQTLITGENLSQVASQTIDNIEVISETVNIPILRPLIGYDKQQIVSLADDIDTFEISKTPYVDCCHLFAPENPETKARLYKIERAEQALDSEQLIDEALREMEVITLEPSKSGRGGRI